MPQKIIKPWGFELLLTNTGLPYVCKVAFTLAGKRWSLQYHDQKHETITLLSGQAHLLLGKTKDSLETVEMEPNVGYIVEPNTIHRFEAITDCVTVEASTPEVGTTYRLEDDYQRSDETQQIRNTPNRGYQNNNT